MVTVRMPKRSSSSGDFRLRKRTSSSNPPSTIDIRAGQILTDISGKQWKLGRTVGIGGFGAIFLATDDITNSVDDTCKYVAKVETHTSGPLFVEINCYIRIAKDDHIKKYMVDRGLSKLGMPHYVASGSHTVKGSKLRFLILPRYDCNLEELFDLNKYLNFKTVLVVAMQLLDIIEYIHENGYVHCDIKASNIMIKKNEVRGFKRRKAGAISLRKKKINLTHFLRSNDIENNIMKNENVDDLVDGNQVYLLDFGLVSKYRQSDGHHKEFCCDQRKAHAGTLLFCSLDAHNGIQVRRSDLESLGYNVVYWLTSILPWMNDMEDPLLVHKMKQNCLANLHNFLERCFMSAYPKFIYDYFKYLVELDFDAEPDYDYCRSLFKRALDNYGYNNQQEYGARYAMHWKKRRELGVKYQISYKLNRVPLSSKPSNLPVKPKRRAKNKAIANLSWSKVLTDPEMILRQANVRDRKLTDTSDISVSVQNMDIYVLNPTYAMVDVYNKCTERLQSGLSPRSYHEDPENIDGYTSAMMAVHGRMLERQQFEEEQLKMTTRNRRRMKRLKRSLNIDNAAPAKTRVTRSRKGSLKRK